MIRKKIIKKKSLKPDAKYSSPVIGLLINYLMVDGKKAKAEKIVNSSLDIASKKSGEEQVKFLESLLDNLKPQYEVKSRRIGGSTYQVPIEVRSERAISLAKSVLKENSGSFVYSNNKSSLNDNDEE